MSAESPAVALDPLVGRSRDIAAVEAALATTRLVTIAGLGGAGKTRLALEVLRRAAARGRTAWVVDLTHISDPAAVPGAIAVALGVGDDADADLLSAIAREASRGQTLLVLDNLEQVVEARRFVVDLLVRAAPLRILATSRVSLGVKGERVVQLDPLAIPATPDEVESSDAGRLFLARARDHGRLRSLTDADREALVEVCRRLDGLPLALELGASWTRLLSPQAIRKRLEEGRLTLAGDDDGGRHATLGAVVESTLGLVRSLDRAVFGSLAVFAGGFDEPAAAAVSVEPDVLSNLRRLEAVSLLRVAGEQDREPRFTLLETIRSVAAAALERAGDDLAVRRRHADYFAAWAEDRVESLRRSGDRRSRTAFETEVPNLFAAYAFAARAGDAVVALSLATSMGVAGRRSPGSLREHIARLEHALGMGWVPPRIRCEGLNALAWLADDVSAESVDIDAVTSEALELATGIGTPLLLARTLIARATVAVPPDAVELLDKAARIAVDAALPFEAASAYNNAADLLARQGHLRAARDLCERAITVSAASGDRFGMSLALQNAGEIDTNLGRLEDGIDELGRSIEGFVIASSGTHLAHSLGLLAAAEALARRPADAYRHLLECAAMIAASEAAGATVNFLGDSVTVLLPANRAIAVRALGAVRSAEARTQPLLGQPLLRMAEAAAVREMGQVRFDRWFEAGANAGPQTVFEEVRGVLLASARPDRRHGVHRLRGAFGEFTARELEVLPLLSEARSDGEIATTLDISPKTASVHVANIKSKLGVETRMEAALRARELLAATPDG
jgi:predicted ATPase/DNA-binding CsgD family transcriptional regulator